MSNRVAAICVLIALSCAGFAHAHTITITGGWNLTIDATDMVGGAGSDITSDYVSAANAVLIDITGTVAPGEPWTVTISKSDVDWDGTLHLSTQRSSDGTGTGTIEDGDSWLELSGTDQTFFTGTEDRASIQMQLMISGASVTLGAKVFTTQILFTLLDT